MVDYFDAVAAHHGGADFPPERGLVHTLFREAEIARMEPLMEFLRGRNDVRVLGPVDSVARAPTVARTLTQCRRIRRNPRNRRDYGGGGDYTPCALGDECEPRSWCVTFSFVHYTSDADIAKLIDALGAHL